MNEFQKDLNYVNGKPLVKGVIRSRPEDFVVNEMLGFSPDHEGQHVFLHIRKRNSNTEWVAKQISRLANVKPLHVSYAGLKDRNAVTTQWFSVNMMNQPEPDWHQLESEELSVLSVDHNLRKLRRGALSGNAFEITVRNLQGNREELLTRLQGISDQGVPNYFGEQRFGYGYSNLVAADAMLTGNKRVHNRHKRSLYISAARSWLFNLVLSFRVGAGNWDSVIPGDLAMLEGTHSYFSVENVDDEIRQRALGKDIHPTGPLWGEGDSKLTLDACQLECEITEPWSSWLQGLAKLGVKPQRRALRIIPSDMEWEFSEDDSMVLRFFLPAGAYATSVLRELVDYQVASVTTESTEYV